MQPTQNKNSIIIGMLAVLIILAAYIAFFKKGNDATKNDEVVTPTGQTQTNQNPNGPDYQPSTHTTPSTILPQYVSGKKWPPVIQNVATAYSCTTSHTEMGDTAQKVIDGKTYCITTFIDAAAGRRDGEYTYVTANASGTKVANFHLEWVSCGGYGGPGDANYDQCQSEQNTFFGTLDVLIDSLMQ